MEVYIGIDWSENKYDMCFMNSAGASIAEQTIRASTDGFLQLDARRRALGVPPEGCLVGLETAHNLMIDFLWAYGYPRVYVVPPSVVKASRRRQGQSGARTDLSDARLIADILRTDPHLRWGRCHPRLPPWSPDSLLTRQMRAKVSLILHLTRQTTRLSNRLRAVLLRYYPAATQVFSDLQTQIALHFIAVYPTPQAAAALSWADFQAFAQQHAYRRPKKLPACFARLQGDFPQASPETVLVYQDEAVQLAQLLLTTVRAKNQAVRTLQALFQQHPDQAIFASLPGAGDLLAPALLTKFGDDRRRFPAPASVQSLAGTCPVTQKSGKRKRVYFRRACDREFRYIAQQWAMTSLSESAWAITYWNTVRPHCQSDSHAYRCLANRWLAIAWKLWQSRTLYDEDYHLQQRAKHTKPRR
jgi:transposase